MPDIIKRLEENFELMFGVALLWVIACALFFAWRRYKRGPTHPPFSEQDVRFSERFASGFSHKSLFTRLGGAHNALVVTVLRQGLLIEPIAIFKWVMPAGFNDLEHYIPKENILSVEPSSSFGRRMLRIQFKGKDGLRNTVELALRKPDEFKLALNV